jgi:hypothetical protein
MFYYGGMCLKIFPFGMDISSNLGDNGFNCGISAIITDECYGCVQNKKQ